MTTRGEMFLVFLATLCVLILVLVFLKWLGVFKKPLPYVRKSTFMVAKEREAYTLLLEQFGREYHVFPQIVISSIVSVASGTKDFLAHLHRINKKTVDFVLFSKSDMQPAVAIEIDGHSHTREKTKKRDLFVEEVFRHVDIPLVRVRNDQINDVKGITSKIEEGIASVKR